MELSQQVLSDPRGPRASSDTAVQAPPSGLIAFLPRHQALPTGRRPVVLVEEACDVDGSPLAAERYLRTHGRDLGLLAEAAEGSGQRLLLRLGACPPALRSVGRVRVQLGQPLRAGSTLAVPFHWQTEGARDRFPLVDGNLDVSPLGHGGSRLALRVAYKPSEHPGGCGLHPAVLERVAASTVRSFLWRVVEEIEHRGPSRGFEQRPGA